MKSWGGEPKRELQDEASKEKHWKTCWEGYNGNELEFLQTAENAGNMPEVTQTHEVELGETQGPLRVLERSITPFLETVVFFFSFLF